MIRHRHYSDHHSDHLGRRSLGRVPHHHRGSRIVDHHIAVLPSFPAKASRNSNMVRPAQRNLEKSVHNPISKVSSMASCPAEYENMCAALI